MSRYRKKAHSDQPLRARLLDVTEVSLISDLQLMHTKINELYRAVANLKRRYRGWNIHHYADQALLNESIPRIDEIYLWLVNLKETCNDNKLSRRNSL